jgi:hypothetical protein
MAKKSGQRATNSRPGGGGESDAPQLKLFGDYLLAQPLKLLNTSNLEGGLKTLPKRTKKTKELGKKWMNRTQDGH